MWPTPISRVAAAIGLGAAATGCGALFGVDWEIVPVDGAKEAGAGRLPDGAPAEDPMRSGVPDTADASAASHLTDGSPGARTDGSMADGASAPIVCVSPQVACVQGCCATSSDPGLPLSVAAGESSTCAVTTTGKVRCWGSNNVGQLGRGTSSGMESMTPTTAYNIPSGATSAAVGMVHACAVVGSFVGCWGANGDGSLGFDTTPYSLAPDEPRRVKNLFGVAASLSAGEYHSCVIVDGTAYCWGSNADLQIAADPSMWLVTTPRSIGHLGTGVIAIGAAGIRSCAIMADGGVSCWGRGNPPARIAGIVGATHLTVAPFHACAVAGGGVQCWGSNIAGELGNTSAGGDTPSVPVGLPSGVTEIRAGGSHTCALVGGAVWCWGSSNEGELGRDLGVGNGRGGPAPVVGVTGATSIASGGGHSCAVAANHVLKCWGRNSRGQLGNGTKDNSPVPVTVTWP